MIYKFYFKYRLRHDTNAPNLLSGLIVTPQEKKENFLELKLNLNLFSKSKTFLFQEKENILRKILSTFLFLITKKIIFYHLIFAMKE
jgi:hypothetical protein